MTNVTKTLWAALVCLLLAGLLPAQASKSLPYYIQWESVAGAGGYVLEVRDPAGKEAYRHEYDANAYDTQLELPAGFYEFRIITLNRFKRQENATDWIQFEVLAYTAPVFTALKPTALEAGKPVSLTLRAERLALRVKASLVSPTGKATPLTIKQTKNSTFTLKGPALEEPGDYTLVLTNPPNLTTRKEAILSVRAPAGTAGTGEKLPDAPATASPASPAAPAAPATPVAPTAPAVVSPATPATSATPASPAATKEPETGASPGEPVRMDGLVRRIAIGAGAGAGMLTGDWGEIYEPACLAGYLSVEAFFSDNRRPASGHGLDYSLGLRADFSRMVTPDSTIYVDSEAIDVSLLLFPAVTLSFPFGSFKLGVGGGINYLGIEADTPGGLDSVSTSSLDASVGAALSYEYPFTDNLACGLGGQALYVFNPEPLAKFAAYAGISVYLPFR